MNIEKHVGIFSSMDEFEAAELTAPWVAYVNESGDPMRPDYKVHYSTNPRVSSVDANELANRISVMESEGRKVYLTASEYETLVSEGKASIDFIDETGNIVKGVKREITFNPKDYYFVYEPEEQ